MKNLVVDLVVRKKDHKIETPSSQIILIVQYWVRREQESSQRDLIGKMKGYLRFLYNETIYGFF